MNHVLLASRTDAETGNLVGAIRHRGTETVVVADRRGEWEVMVVGHEVSVDDPGASMDQTATILKGVEVDVRCSREECVDVLSVLDVAIAVFEKFVEVEELAAATDLGGVIHEFGDATVEELGGLSRANVGAVQATRADDRKVSFVEVRFDEVVFPSGAGTIGDFLIIRRKFKQAFEVETACEVLDMEREVGDFFVSGNGGVAGSGSTSNDMIHSRLADEGVLGSVEGGGGGGGGVTLNERSV